MNLKNLLISILFCLVAYVHLNAQAVQVILVKGHVTNSSNNAPVATKIFFINPDGKRTISNSNSTDGSYQVVLNHNTEYTVSIENFIINGSDSKISLPKVKEYTEMTFHFTGKEIKEGVHLYDLNCFNHNNPDIVRSRLHQLDELKELMKTNPRVNLKVTVSTADSYFKPKKVSVTDESSKSKKKKKKTITITTEEQLKELLAARVNNLKQEFESAGIRLARIEFLEELIVGSQPKSTQKKKKTKGTSKDTEIISSKPAVIVSVGRILKL